MKIEMKYLNLLRLVDECMKKHKKVFKNRKMLWDKGGRDRDLEGFGRISEGLLRKRPVVPLLGRGRRYCLALKNEHSGTAATVECSTNHSTIF